MLTDDQRAALDAAWSPARTAGVIGDAPIEELCEHAAGFVRAACSTFSLDPERFDGSVVDVGTGAGLPGVILAALLPQAHCVLIDSSERRLDHVRRAARALGVQERVKAVHGRAEDLAHQPEFRGRFQLAVARLLSEPNDTAELLVGFLAPASHMVVSSARRHRAVWESLPWDDVPLELAGFHDEGGLYAAVGRCGELPATLPRSPKQRQRRPYGP